MRQFKRVREFLHPIPVSYPTPISRIVLAAFEQILCSLYRKMSSCGFESLINFKCRKYCIESKLFTGGYPPPQLALSIISIGTLRIPMRPTFVTLIQHNPKDSLSSATPTSLVRPWFAKSLGQLLACVIQLVRPCALEIQKMYM